MIRFIRLIRVMRVIRMIRFIRVIRVIRLITGRGCLVFASLLFRTFSHRDTVHADVSKGQEALSRHWLRAFVALEAR
jgi:hypothetical protein